MKYQTISALLLLQAATSSVSAFTVANGTNNASQLLGLTTRSSGNNLTKLFAFVDNDNIERVVLGEGDKYEGRAVGTLGVQENEAYHLAGKPKDAFEGTELVQFSFAPKKIIKEHTHETSTFNFINKGSVSITNSEGYSAEYTKGDFFFVEKGTPYKMEAGDDGLVYITAWNGNVYWVCTATENALKELKEGSD